MSASKFLFGLDHLSTSKAIRLAKIYGPPLEGVFSLKAKQRIEKSAQCVEKLSHSTKKVVYGINTGLGPLCTKRIAPQELIDLQHNLLRSHSVGVGPAMPRDVVRLMMILKIHSLARAYSGVKFKTLERLLYFLENKMIPVVPTQGSVGASGDLAPLAHMCLPLIGLGSLESESGEVMPTQNFLKQKKLSPIELSPKEGLALINGTQFIAGYAVMALFRS
jgi:histidine ammonia-lyase